MLLHSMVLKLRCKPSFWNHISHIHTAHAHTAQHKLTHTHTSSLALFTIYLVQFAFYLCCYFSCLSIDNKFYDRCSHFYYWWSLQHFLQILINNSQYVCDISFHVIPSHHVAYFDIEWSMVVVHASNSTTWEVEVGRSQ